jgi:hypothetical protein
MQSPEQHQLRPLEEQQESCFAGLQEWQGGAGGDWTRALMAPGAFGGKGRHRDTSLLTNALISVNFGNGSYKSKQIHPDEVMLNRTSSYTRCKV